MRLYFELKKNYRNQVKVLGKRFAIISVVMKSELRFRGIRAY